MASTYTPISTYTVPSAQSSVTLNSFSGYTDLVLISNSLTTANTTVGSITVNGDTGSNYSEVYLYGLGSGSGASGLQSNQTKWISQFGRTTPSPMIMHLFNYSNTTTYKTALIRMSAPDYAVWASSNMWRSTAAITSITLAPTGANWAAGATFTLYGIKAA